MVPTEHSQLGFDFDGRAPAVGSTVALVEDERSSRDTPSRDTPSRGRAATRAQTAVLLCRLQDHGLRGIDALVLMRTRTVMVSLIGKTLRVHEGYADAPEHVLRAIVTFATSRVRSARAAAKERILAHDVERVPAVRRVERARPGDLALVSSLQTAHQELNNRWFAGKLQPVSLRVS
ncbi:MAG: hypothetical protein ABIW79_11520 [Gemmatimonas sp.]